VRVRGSLRRRNRGGEIDVVPGQAEQLGDAKSAVQDGRDHQAVARDAGAEQALDLGATQHSLAAALWPRTLIALELLDRVGAHRAVAAGEAHYALERRQCVRRGLCRAPLAPQGVQ